MIRFYPNHVIRCIAFVFMIILCKPSHGQDVSVAPDTIKVTNPLLTDITLSSRMIWRGIDFASSPSLQGLLAYRKKNFEAGAFSCVTLNGDKVGLGNTLEVYASYSFKNFTFTVDDYFFFNEHDSTNNYFEWGSQKTQHFVEGRLKYVIGKLAFTGAYVLHTSSLDDTKGVYLEAEYSPTSYLTIFSGGVTEASMLNFQESGGITNVGITGKRSIPVTETYSLMAKLSVIASPNYKSIVELPGVGTNPIYFVLSITF